jgi:hypothetical protein
VAYCEIAYEMDGPELPTALRGPLGITFHRNEKANVIAYCLENPLTSYDPCEENHERRVAIRFQALLASVDETPVKKDLVTTIN